MVSYSGRPPGQPAYQCDRPNLMLELPRCFTFGGLRVDAVVTREMLRAVELMAIEAAVAAKRRYMETRGEQQRIIVLELQQARYETALAERRYAACDPDKRQGRGRRSTPPSSRRQPANPRNKVSHKGKRGGGRGSRCPNQPCCG